jgi:hypothetical protein
MKYVVTVEIDADTDFPRHQDVVDGVFIAIRNRMDNIGFAPRYSKDFSVNKMRVDSPNAGSLPMVWSSPFSA